MLGGYLADRVLGQRRTVIIGAALMAIGHFMMAFEPLFLLALLVLILGNGAFKPNISTQVGTLYAPGDPRRDRAFSIFYVGINLGAFLAPLVCGTLGEELGWHYGFGAAGIGMTIGLAIYLYASRDAAARRAKPRAGRRQAAAVRPRRMARDGRAHAARAAGDVLLGDLRAAGQHHRAVGRRLHRPHHQPAGLGRANPGHLVPGVQSVHDLRLHAVRPGAVEAAGGTRPRALDRHQDGARLLRRRAVLPDHGRRGAAAPAAARRAGSGSPPISSSSPSASFICRRSASRWSPRSRRPAPSR